MTLYNHFDLIGLLDSYRPIFFYGGGVKVTQYNGITQYKVFCFDGFWWVLLLHQIGKKKPINYENATEDSASCNLVAEKNTSVAECGSNWTQDYKFRKTLSIEKPVTKFCPRFLLKIIFEKIFFSFFALGYFCSKEYWWILYYWRSSWHSIKFYT